MTRRGMFAALLAPFFSRMAKLFSAFRKPARVSYRFRYTALMLENAPFSYRLVRLKGF